MHDTVCHTWSTAHEDPILTPSVTHEDAREYKDMRKRVSACSTGLPLSITRIVHGGVRIIEKSMTTSRCMKRRSRKHIDTECARRPLLLAAGRAPLQHLFHKEKEAIRTYTGLRKHEYRSRVHVRSSAVEGSRLANKAKSDGSDGWVRRQGVAHSLPCRLTRN